MLTNKQLEARKLGIGASEAATVMGLNKYMSPYQLWRIKSGLEDAADLSDVPQVQWGSIHEESIAQQYAKVTNTKVRKMSHTLYHKQYPFVLCHIDRKIEGLSKLLECKFAMYHNDDWGPDGSDIVPLSYIIQVQYQLAITGYAEADLAVLISGWDFRIYHFKRDEMLINRIIEDVKKFWHCVESGTEPELRDRQDAVLAYPNSNGNAVEANQEMLETVTKLNILKKQIKDYEEEKKFLEAKLILFLKDGEVLAHHEKRLATYKSTARGNRVLRLWEAYNE
jgi:putative phage-type endonuclease